MIKLLKVCFPGGLGQAGRDVGFGRFGLVSYSFLQKALPSVDGDSASVKNVPGPHRHVQLL